MVDLFVTQRTGRDQLRPEARRRAVDQFLHLLPVTTFFLHFPEAMRPIHYTHSGNMW